MIAILIFILILSFLVMIHEFGHFIMAKRGGIGVEEFGFGLPPRIWGKKHKGTIYSINWLPFGGFVKLVGEDSLDKKSGAENSFQVKSLSRRMAVVLAGVFMNFVLAVIIFYVIVISQGFKVYLQSEPVMADYKFRFVSQSQQIAVFPVAGSPAEAAGVKAGDLIVEANGVAINSTENLKAIVGTNENTPVIFTLSDPNGERRQVTIIPKYDEKSKAPAIGVSTNEFIELNYETLPQKLFAGFIHSYNFVDVSVNAMSKLIGTSFAQKDIGPVGNAVSGPVGIAAMANRFIDVTDPLALLSFAGFLSLNLAVMNVLPIPALDGGRFFFLVVEAVTRRRVYPSLEKWTNTVGFVILIGLIVLITYSDILKIIK